MEIQNELLKVSVDLKGGALTSIYDLRRNVELIYQPLPDSWQGHDVFIFPFVARLVNGTYTLEGKEYEFKNHGLIRYMTGEGKIENDDLFVTFRSDEETLKRYPFDFEAVSQYHLNGNELTISYHIKNLSKKDMPFMVGGHPAFKVPGKKTETEFDISGNYLSFEKKLPLTRVTQEETFSFNTGEELFMETDRIDFTKALFNKINTIILKGDNFDVVTLHKNDGSKVRMDKHGAKYLALWSDKKWGDYVAVEPWDGIPDSVNPDKDMYKKPGIQVLPAGEEFVFSYTLTID